MRINRNERVLKLHTFIFITRKRPKYLVVTEETITFAPTILLNF
jgi:hypothetical protein